MPRRALIAGWLFLSTLAAAQTVDELKAKLAQADIDKAVMAERARFSASQVLIALIGALPALYAAYLTFLGNKIAKNSSDVTHSIAAANGIAPPAAAEEKKA